MNMVHLSIYLEFFSQQYCSFQCRSLTCLWLSLIVNILFSDAVINCFKNLFSSCLLWVHKHTADFVYWSCTLWPYWYLFCRLHRIFSFYIIMSSANRDSLIVICVFIFLSICPFLARTSITMLNQSSGSGCPYHVPILKGSISYFTIKCDVVSLSDWGYPLPFLVFWEFWRFFSINGYWILSKDFSLLKLL